MVIPQWSEHWKLKLEALVPFAGDCQISLSSISNLPWNEIYSCSGFFPRVSHLPYHTVNGNVKVLLHEGEWRPEPLTV